MVSTTPRLLTPRFVLVVAVGLAYFLSLSAVHELSAIRRSVLNRLTPLGSLKQHTPDNIHDFVRALAKRPSAVMP